MAEATVQLNKAHFPVTVLGPGRRIGLWLQGCSIHCPGCLSRDTWAPDPARAVSVAALLQWCREASGGRPDGVTISGGEPFDQPEALGALLDALVRWRTRARLDFDILCYSGRAHAWLARRHPRLLARLDALVAEPYVESLPATRLWRGSANQPLLPLSARGRARYAPWLEAPAEAGGRRLQLAVDGERAWFVGIPGRGDLDAAAGLCAARGLALDSVSWRP